MLLKFKKRVREVNFKYSSLSGQICSKKLNKPVQFESSLERDFIYLLEFDFNVKKYLEQPCVIPYRDEFNNLRKYTPDFIVSYYDKFRKNEIVEIKYQKELDEKKNELETKFEAARLFCVENNLLFRICSDKYIREKNGTKLRNVKFLSRYRDYFDNINYSATGVVVDSKNTMLLLDKLKILKECTINELIKSITDNKYKQAELIFLTWYLIANNFIDYNVNDWLNLDSKIWLD